MSSVVPPYRAKAIFERSGDQAGSKSLPAVPSVSPFWPLPSAFMAQISYGGGGGGRTIRVKARWPLSGDHVGHESSLGSFVRFVWWLPSALIE